MKFKHAKKSISAILISGIIFSLFAVTACGKNTEDDVDLSPVASIGDGAAQDLTWTNGKTVYAIVSYQPLDKSEGHDIADAIKAGWVIASTVKGKSSVAEMVYNNIFSDKDISKLPVRKVISSAQADLDLRLRESENKALAERLPQFSKKMSKGSSKSAPATINKGTTWNGVYILIDSGSSTTTIDTTCRYISDHAYFFVDNSDTSAMSSLLADYGTAFDAIYDVNHDKFGTENDLDNNDKVIIVFTHAITGGTLGYFFSADKYLYDAVDNPNSNEGDIFYMTTDAEWQGDTIKGTLAHEFQHMIYFDQHYNYGVSETYTWLNEALSQAAEFYNGYLSNHNNWIYGYLAGDWDGLSLTYWTSNNYGYGAIFIRYLIDQFGDTAIKNMCSTDKVGVAAVEAATGADFNAIFNNFTRAIVFSGTGDSVNPAYNFVTLDIQALKPATATVRAGLIPSLTIVAAGDGGSTSTYPYEIFFFKGSGNFGTMTLTGTEVEGTVFGLTK